MGDPSFKFSCIHHWFLLLKAYHPFPESRKEKNNENNNSLELSSKIRSNKSKNNYLLTIDHSNQIIQDHKKVNLDY